MSAGSTRKSLLAHFKGGVFNGVGRGGPGRLVMIVGVGGAMIALAVGLSINHQNDPVESKVAKMKAMNLLPGGTHSTPAQESLLLRHSQVEADKALKQNVSYTPPMPGSVDMNARAPAEIGLDLTPPPAPTPPVQVASLDVDVHPVPVPPPPYVAPETRDPPEARIEQISASTVSEMDPEVKKALNDMFSGWDGRPPRTDIVLAPAEMNAGEASGRPAATPERAVAAPARDVEQVVLVPAGRGIYAHTVLSVNSDTGGPIILEADTGPLVGDRMLGTFSKNQGERLVVRVTSIEHRGKSLQVAGLVVAPDSMETSVASSVDEHYFERFALPAAAAFVEGLGQAVAMTNATTSVSPFGGTTTTYGSLNFKQQAAVAAGAAAQAVGSALQSSTPKGPTINLASNVGVGVVFLSNVTEPK